MGNNHSSTSASTSTGSHQSANNSIAAAFRRSAGSLGLSRVELDRRCQPSGLYPSCTWDDRLIRRLIGDGKLAARMRGAETRESKTEVECPICFLYYEQVNSTKCCKAFICTECFLQFNPPPNRKYSSGNSKTCDCPFCNSPELHVQVSAQDSNVLKNAERDEEEQKILEAKIRSEFEERQKSLVAVGSSPSEFGRSLLDHHSSTRKLTSDSSGSDFSNPCIATVEDRAAIEEEMKHQHLHPLVRRIQEEAEEASNARAQEYMLSNRGRRGRVRERYADAARSSILLGRHDRDWNRDLEGLGRGDMRSIDDLLVIEAAILLSMEEAARRRESNGSESSDSDTEHVSSNPFSVLTRLMSSSPNIDLGDGDEPGDLFLRRNRIRNRHGRSLALTAMMTEEAQIAMAIALSLRDADAAQGASSGDEQSTEDTFSS